MGRRDPHGRHTRPGVAVRPGAAPARVRVPEAAPPLLLGELSVFQAIICLTSVRLATLITRTSELPGRPGLETELMIIRSAPAHLDRSQALWVNLWSCYKSLE